MADNKQRSLKAMQPLCVILHILNLTFAENMCLHPSIKAPNIAESFQSN